MPDRRGCSRANGRRQRSREDETRGVAAYRVHQCRRPGDVAAKTAECLGERPFQHIDAPHCALLFGHAATTWTIHADSMHLVGVSHCAVTLGKIANPIDGSDVPIHRIERLEYNELWPTRLGGLEKFFEVVGIVMIEDSFFCAGLANT